MVNIYSVFFSQPKFEKVQVSKLNVKMQSETKLNCAWLFVLAGSGQPVNGAIPSLPSPTMPTFNMAAQTPNGQPGGTEATVYTNGIPQTYPGRKYKQLNASHAKLQTTKKTVPCLIQLKWVFFVRYAIKIVPSTALDNCSSLETMSTKPKA